jgi:hypothetical protein
MCEWILPSMSCMRIPPDGRDVLEALRYARWPYRWYAEFQGAPPYTTVAIKSKTKIVSGFGWVKSRPGSSSS